VAVTENVLLTKMFLAHWSHMCGINEPPVWDLWTTSENPVIFKSNTAKHARYLVETQFI